jgi:hypothetical protein
VLFSPNLAREYVQRTTGSTTGAQVCHMPQSLVRMVPDNKATGDGAGSAWVCLLYKPVRPTGCAQRIINRTMVQRVYITPQFSAKMLMGNKAVGGGARIVNLCFPRIVRLIMEECALLLPASREAGGGVEIVTGCFLLTTPSYTLEGHVRLEVTTDPMMAARVFTTRQS